MKPSVSWFGGVASFLAIACQSAPTATPGAPSAGESPPTAPPGAVSAARGASTPTPGPPSAPSSATPLENGCDDLRKAVVAEAGKLAHCESDADCKVHRIGPCDFRELDCHAAHVRADGSTKLLDDAVSAYTARCTVSKCKCQIPASSVCRGGKCAGG